MVRTLRKPRKVLLLFGSKRFCAPGAGTARGGFLQRKQAEARARPRIALASLGYTRLIAGGQIARAAALFLPYADAGAEAFVAAHPEDAALRRIALYCALGYDATMEEGAG